MYMKCNEDGGVAAKQSVLGQIVATGNPDSYACVTVKAWRFSHGS